MRRAISVNISADDNNNFVCYIYTGADCSAYYYQDDGDGYSYESGAYIKIKFDWHDASNTLTIHKPEGKTAAFPLDKTVRVYVNGNPPPSADGIPLWQGGKEIPLLGGVART